MEKNPEKEIFLDPRWSILMDGLGYQVLVVGGMPQTDKDGRDVIIFTIKPDETVRKRYNLRKDIEIDDSGNMRLIVAKEDLIPLNVYDDANKKWLYEKSLTHQPTDLSERFTFLKIKLREKDNRIHLLDAENIRLNEQLELARLNTGKFLKQGTEIYHEAMKGVSDIMGKKKDE